LNRVIDKKTEIIFKKLLKQKNVPFLYNQLNKMHSEVLNQFIDYMLSIFEKNRYKIQMIKNQIFNIRIKKKQLEYIISYIIDNNVKISGIKSVKIHGLEIGKMYSISYRFYQHDPFPLAIFLNAFDEEHLNFKVINLHYLPFEFRRFLIQRILLANKARINVGKEPIVTTKFIKQYIPDLSLCYRCYKIEGIKILEKISPQRWTTYLSIDKRHALQ